MPWINAVLFGYAGLLLALGAYGYFAKGSIVSIIAGTVAALLVIGTLALAKSHPRPARIAAAVIALLMLGQMGPKALEGGGWHTATIAIVSLLVLLCLVAAHFIAIKAKKSAVEPQ
jgi:hypothetical protein